MMTNEVLEYAVYRAVSLAVGGAAGDAVSWVAYEALYQAVFRPIRWAMHKDIAQPREPPHPGLGLYLAGVA